jgi:hypothetical protein
MFAFFVPPQRVLKLFKYLLTGAMVILVILVIGTLLAYNLSAVDDLASTCQTAGHAATSINRDRLRDARDGPSALRSGGPFFN